MSSASDSESDKSDIVLQSRLVPQKGIKKPPKSPQEHLKKDPKKLTTKEMIHSALGELKSRKGVSLHAIKKYMVETYHVDTDKINFYIKKYIKIGVEDGTIVQTKGIGASGSFKLAPAKKVEKPKKKKMEKPVKPKKEVTKKVDPENKKTEKKVAKKEVKKTTMKEKTMKEKSTKEKDLKKPKAKMTKEKMTKESQKGSKKKIGGEQKKTPTKKKVTIIKRKSIGSIIKPPKMKPKKRD
ncbi:linker histone h1 and h5 family domain-containing protein [Phthorimaea operculella]|nr:linker histone h1 and h5 family domain-containing protein [Phthorimaea operculella]